MWVGLGVGCGRCAVECGLCRCEVGCVGRVRCEVGVGWVGVQSNVGWDRCEVLCVVWGTGRCGLG